MASPLPSFAPPSADLRSAIHSILSPSWSAQAVIDGMLLAKGSIGAAGAVARRLGLRNRFELAAWFARHGLPTMHELAGWISVLSWLERWERAGIALCAAALEEGRDPAACYRLVQRITGMSWGQVQTAGLSWALDRFAERCRHRLERTSVNRWRVQPSRPPVRSPRGSRSASAVRATAFPAGTPAPGSP